MSRIRIPTNAAWTDTTMGYAVGSVPHGPLLVLQGSSALIWDLIQLRDREPFDLDDLIEELFEDLRSNGYPPDESVAAQTKAFVAELMRSGLLIVDQAD